MGVAVEVTDEQLCLWEQSAKILSGTGHRPQKLGDEFDLVGPYSSHITGELQQLFNLLNPTQIVSGMALGFDQLLALYALEQGIPVLAAIPCDNQEKVWPKKSQERYHQILSNKLVTKYTVCSGKYHPGMMQVRNEWMCDHSDALVAAWDGTSGGTANCVKYARKNDMSIFYINLNFKEKDTKKITLFD